MDERPPASTPTAPAPATLLVCLYVLAALAAIGGVLAGGIYLLKAMRAGQVDMLVVLGVLARLLAGAVPACVLWAAGWLVRRVHDVSLLQRRVLSELICRWGRAEGEASRPGGGDAAEGDRASEILSRLEEIQATVLLTPQQLETKRERHQSQRKEQLCGEFEHHLADGNFAGAQEALRQIERDLPGDPDCRELSRRLGEARQSALAEDIRLQRRRVEDFMSVAAFAEAQEAAEQLRASHPDADEAAVLVDRVRREAQTYHTERRAGLYEQIERAAEARRWSEALATVRKLLEAYPHSAEAQTVTLQLQTLEENARLEEVRDLRDRFRDLLARKRFAEALEVAGELMDRFPDTQAAADLRGQMDRLRRLAAGEGESPS